MNDVTPESSGASAASGNNNNINGNGKASSGTAVTANGGEGISAAVAKVLQGYDWTLVPVATK